jgi:hypothetical protein
MTNILIITNFEGEYGLKNKMAKNLYKFYLFLKNNSKFQIELIDSSQQNLIKSKINEK